MAGESDMQEAVSTHVSTRRPGSDHPALIRLHPEDQLLLRGHSDSHLESLGLPPRDLAIGRLSAYIQLTHLLHVQADQVQCSPLGPEWSRDLDLWIADEPHLLSKAGWLPIDAFLGALGSPGRGRWAIRADGRILGQADFAAELKPAVPSSPAQLAAKAESRARDRGRIELREVLELRHLARNGHRSPTSEIATAAARLEAQLAGNRAVKLELSQSTADEAIARTGPSHKEEGVRRRLGAVRRWFRPRPVVALSGVDGAGKSSLTAALLQDFERLGIRPEVIWARPGMRMDWIEPLLGKRSKQATPTVAKVASGQEFDARSRRGFIGWSWTMLVTGTFLTHLWWSHIRHSGLKIYDRHLDDAIVTLDFVYAGVDLRLPRALISRLMPRPSVTFYLDVDAETAVARKPGDTFGHHAVESQLRRYAARLEARKDVVVLDATRDPRDIANDAFARILAEIE